MSTPISIAIIGAGPAGLTLARLLLLAFPPNPINSSDLDIDTYTNSVSASPRLRLTVFESDHHPTSPQARPSQGGTLDLHPTTGLLALKKANLFDAFQVYARYEGEELYLADLNGQVYVHVDEKMMDAVEQRPEIDRKKLVGLLLKGVEEVGGAGEAGVVKWGRRVKRVFEMGEDDGVEKGAEGGRGKAGIEFVDGTKESGFDLIIGADGAWTRVRSILSDVVPLYSGICGFQADIPLPVLQQGSETANRVNKMVGRGSYFAYGRTRSVTAQRMGNDSIKLGFWMKEPETYPDTIKGEGEPSVGEWRERLLGIYDEWHERYKDLIKLGEHFRTWKLYELPVGFSYPHRPGFTLLGDAAHLMTPFAGEGVNTAMKDALELAEAITEVINGKTSLDEAVRTYEAGLFPRGKKVQEETMINKVGMFQEDAPVGWLVSMVGNFAEQAGYDLDQGWVSWIPVRSVAYSVFWTIGAFGAATRTVGGMWNGK